MGCVANFGEIVNILEILAGISEEKRPLAVAYRGGGDFTPLPPKLRSFGKAESNSHFRGKVHP
jgi:hypothetical protein